MGKSLQSQPERRNRMGDSPKVRKHSGREKISLYLPVSAWLPSYEKKWLLRDLIAGLTVWGILVPESIAYAGLAGAPAQAGLYTLLATLTIYALLGTNKQLILGATSATAIMVGSALAPVAAEDPARFTAMLAALVIMVGVIFLIAGLLKMGWVSRFMSEPVMTGFVFGLAIFIAVRQLSKLFGISRGEGNVFQQLWHVITSLGNANWYAFAIGVTAIVALVMLEKYVPRVPGALVCLVLGIIVVTIFDLASNHGVAVAGKIPTGLPELVWPGIKLSDLGTLLPAALGITLVSLSETLGVTKTFAEKHHYSVDNNQDMRAIGIAQIGAGFIGGLAAGGSMSSSMVNDKGGAKTQLASFTAAVLILLTVLFLTPLFKNLPEAVLASIIIVAVIHLMKVGEMRRFHRLRPSEFWLAMVALVGVLVWDILPGLLIAVVLSLLLLIWNASRPGIDELGRVPEKPGEYSSMARHPDNETIEGLRILRVDAKLFFANSSLVREKVEEVLKSDPRPSAVMLDLQASDDLDISSTDMLSKLLGQAETAGVELLFVEVTTPVKEMLRTSGLMDRIGEEKVVRTIDEGVNYFLEDTARA